MVDLKEKSKSDVGLFAVGIFRAKYLDDNCLKYLSELNFKRFTNEDTMENKIAMESAISVYLESGSIERAAQAARQLIDLESRELSLIDMLINSDFLSELTKKIYDDVLKSKFYDGKAGNLAKVGRAILEEVVSIVQKTDQSQPLDISKGKNVIVYYVPGASDEEKYQDVITSSWLKRSNALSIYPDKTFCDFLEVVGVSKDDWIAAVANEALPSHLKLMEKHMDSRASEWEMVESWPVNGSLDIETEDLVAAVDACPFGFTPVIAFEIPSEEIFKMDFTEDFDVAGGIIGLHDFKTGSGDPLRFEGTLKISPKRGDLYLAGDDPLGLVATHGFQKASFQSVVKRSEDVDVNSLKIA